MPGELRIVAGRDVVGPCKLKELLAVERHQRDGVRAPIAVDHRLADEWVFPHEVLDGLGGRC
jgi:hypothetical protein